MCFSKDALNLSCETPQFSELGMQPHGQEDCKQEEVINDSVSSWGEVSREELQGKLLGLDLFSSIIINNLESKQVKLMTSGDDIIEEAGEQVNKETKRNPEGPMWKGNCEEGLRGNSLHSLHLSIQKCDSLHSMGCTSGKCV